MGAMQMRNLYAFSNKPVSKTWLYSISQSIVLENISVRLSFDFLQYVKSIFRSQTELLLLKGSSNHHSRYIAT